MQPYIKRSQMMAKGIFKMGKDSKWMELPCEPSSHLAMLRITCHWFLKKKMLCLLVTMYSDMEQRYLKIF